MYQLRAPSVFFKRFQETAIIPTYGHDDNTNAGVDLYSCEEVLIPAGSQYVVNTGIGWDPSDLTIYDNGCKVVMVVNSRSGLAFKEGIEASNAGIIDESYRGEIKVLLHNSSVSDYLVKVGDRIAQGLILYMPLVTIRETKVLSDTDRGGKGFGSTGK